MQKLNRHGGGPAPQQMGQSSPQKDMMRGALTNHFGAGQGELQRAAGFGGGGGSVTEAVQQMRRAQGLPIGGDMGRGTVGPGRPGTNMGNTGPQEQWGQAGKGGSGPGVNYQRQNPNQSNYLNGK